MSDPLLRNVPPNNPEAEDAVLGSIMLDPEAIDVVRPILSPASFYRPANAVIYAALVGLRQSRNPCDVVALNDQLSQDGTLDEVGGTIRLAELTEKVATGANAEYWARRVLDAATLRNLIEVCARGQRMAYDASWQAEETARNIERMVIDACRGVSSQDNMSQVGELAPQLFDAYRKTEETGEQPGMLTGLDDLDEITGGILPGQFITVGARPSHGKTALLVTIMRHVAKQYGPCLMFSLETDKLTIARAVAVAEGDVDNRAAQRGWLEGAGRRGYIEGLDALDEIPIHVESRARNVEQIVSIARRAIAKHNVRLIGVDYVQKVKSELRFQSTAAHVSHVSGELSDLSRDTGVPLLALAQIRRFENGRAKRPTLSGLKESGRLEEDSDQSWLLWRPQRFEGEGDPAESYVDVAKNKQGPCDVARLKFRPERGEFVNYQKPEVWQQ